MESDASETIKMDAKRQAVIYLARFYEHQAISLQADQRNNNFGPPSSNAKPSFSDRIAWLNRRKMSCSDQSHPAISAKPEATQLGDPLVPDLSITQIYDELDAYPAEVLNFPRLLWPCAMPIYSMTTALSAKQKANANRPLS